VGTLKHNWAIAYDNIRDMFVPALLFLMLTWFFYIGGNQSSLTGYENTDAVIIDIDPPSGKENDPQFTSLVLELPDKNVITINSETKQVPQIGNKVPFSIEYFDNKTKRYSIRYNEWTKSKPEASSTAITKTTPNF